MHRKWIIFQRDLETLSFAGRNLNKILAAAILIPYFWLLIPLLAKSGELFGKIGFRLSNLNCNFDIICGAKISPQMNFYIFFWVVP